MHYRNKKIHQCPICPKRFEFVSKLHRHQLTHSGQRPFTCAICPKSFTQLSHLKRHLESHENPKPVSQFSYTNTEDGYTPYDQPQTSVFGQTGISHDTDLGEQSIWYNSQQILNETEWKQDQDNCLNEQELAEDPLGNTAHPLTVNPPSLEQRQSEDNGVNITQWDYGGFGDMAEKENDCHQNSQYSSFHSETGLAKQEDSNLICHNEDSQMDLTASNSCPGPVSQETMDRTPKKNQCATCLKCFSAPSKLRRHVMIHSSQRPFACQLCPKAFRQLAHLKIHLTTHFSQRRNQTRPRLQKAASRQYLPLISSNKTLGNSSKLLMAQCKEENKDFKSEITDITIAEDVENEMKNLAGENLPRSKIMHECPVCFKCFSAPSKLRRHCLIHTGQRPFQCSLCSRSFRQLAHLKAHCSIHVSARKKTSSIQRLRSINQPRLGRLAGNSFSRRFKQARALSTQQTCVMDRRRTSPTSLTERIIPHTGLSDIKDTEQTSREDTWCSFCSKRFSAPSKLRRHILIHTGQKPFKCVVCLKGFTQRAHLKVHKCRGRSQGSLNSAPVKVQTIEKMDRFGPCASGLSKNLAGDATNIQESFTEDIPSDSFTSSLKCKPGDALQCKSSANVRVEGPSIIATESHTKESRHQCTICLKMFDFPSKLSRHLLIHMDIKPFTCSICSRSFRQLSHLQSHERIHLTKRKILRKGSRKSPKHVAASKTSELLNEVRVQDSGKRALAKKPDPDCVILVNNDSQDLEISPLHKLTPSAKELSVPFKADTNYQLDISKRKAANLTSDPKKQNVNQCTFCYKVFDFPSKLSRHLRIHTGIRPFECRICHKSFKQLSHLQCHQWVHNKKVKSLVTVGVQTQDNPVSSDWSEEKNLVSDFHQERSGDFSTVQQGYDALPQHPNWNPAELPQCHSSGLDQKANCIKSEVDLPLEGSVHLALKYETSVIGADGVSRNLDWDNPGHPEPRDPGQFEESVEKKHPGQTDVHSCVPEHCPSRLPTVSESCKIGFSFEQNTLDPSEFEGFKEEKAKQGCNEHLTKPPNDLPICPGCSQCFPTLKKLNAHKCPVQAPQEKLRKSYHCAVCFKTFEAPSKLKRHYVIHTGQRPFQCSLCNKAFTQSGHLKTHMYSHR
ncbi:zinc finger protein 770 [Hoplias malabaricus]|uniref:zinc finger protein 770 n=1 Tax=Hoplias malabaricus TaxID=27720 RepID=UPI003461BB5A